MNPNNPFSGNNTPDQPTSPNDTFGSTPEESSNLQQVENSTPVSDTSQASSADPSISAPVETPSPAPTLETTTNEPATAVVAPVAPTADPNAPKKSKKGLIIIASVLLVLGIAAGSYAAWAALSPNDEVPATSDTATNEQANEEQPAPVENAEQLDAEIDAITSDLNGIDDTEFSDETISDSTLEQ